MDVQEMHPSNLQDVLLREGKLQPARAQLYMAEIVRSVPLVFSMKYSRSTPRLSL